MNDTPVADPRADFVEGATAVVPVIVGAVPFALVFGAIAAKNGLSPLEVALMSALVFAGSAQFAAAELWTTPAAIGALGLTALFINLRHVLMGIALAPHLTGFARVPRILALLTMADEIWALALKRSLEKTLTPAFYAGMALCLWLNWVLFSGLGAIAGAFIDDPVAYGFDFAFVAIFMALLKGFWSGSGTLVVWAASALTALAVSQMIEGPWYVVAGALAGMAAAFVQPIARPDAEASP